MRLILLCSILIIIGNTATTTAQQVVVGGFKDESALYAETKQVNQFIRRFNNEEGVSGDRYYKKDSLFRDPKSRKKYLDILFDLSNSGLTKEIKNDFIQHITNKSDPLYLNFHGGKWFAQVHATFSWQGKDEKATLFLELQKEEVGSKWIISEVVFPPMAGFFSKDTAGNKYFLHPLSHEIEFMNLERAFNDERKNIESYTARNFNPDVLSLFIYEVKKGSLKFKTVNKVKFHFFQIPGWYFELSLFNRSGNNTGWLISKLVKVNEKEQKTLEDYIYSADE